MCFLYRICFFNIFNFRVKLQSTLARQTRDLEKLVQATEASADDSKKLPIGNKASRLLLTAEKRSWEVGHAAVETDDVLG